LWPRGARGWTERGQIQPWLREALVLRKRRRTKAVAYLGDTASVEWHDLAHLRDLLDPMLSNQYIGRYTVSRFLCCPLAISLYLPIILECLILSRSD